MRDILIQLSRKKYNFNGVYINRNQNIPFGAAYLKFLVFMHKAYIPNK